MKIKEIWDVAIEAGMKADPRPMKEIRAVLADRKNAYRSLKGIHKEIVDRESLTNPFCDSRIIFGRRHQQARPHPDPGVPGVPEGRPDEVMGSKGHHSFFRRRLPLALARLSDSPWAPAARDN